MPVTRAWRQFLLHGFSPELIHHSHLQLGGHGGPPGSFLFDPLCFGGKALLYRQSWLSTNGSCVLTS